MSHKLPKYLTEEKSIKKKSIKTERKACKKRGGILHPKSGAGKFKKCDFHIGDIQYEHKATMKKGFRLDFDYIAHVFDSAVNRGTRAIICIDAIANHEKPRSFVVMDEAFFNELTNKE